MATQQASYYQFQEGELLLLMERSLRADLYLREFDDLMVRLSLSEGGKRQIALRIGLAKELQDELHAIAVFADRHLQHETPRCEVRWVSGNQKHDAVVIAPTGAALHSPYLEVTCLEDLGYTRVLEAVAEAGFHERQVNPESEVQRLSSLLKARLAAKARLRLDGDQYPPGTTLLIFVKLRPPVDWAQLVADVMAGQDDIFTRFVRVCVFDRKTTYADWSRPS